MQRLDVRLETRDSEMDSPEPSIPATTTTPTACATAPVQAFQNLGAHRRCLQFEDAQHNVTSSRHHPSDAKGAKSLSLETPSVLIDGKLYSRNTLSSSINLPKPSATTDGNKLESPKASLTTFGDKRKTIEKGSGPEEIYKISPKKKRMNTTDSGEDCKRCSCKRSQCLKLYCSCFAAGFYCAEPCACQECLNRPDYEDTVDLRREKIESRDPLAFAPRIVQHIIEQPQISRREAGANFTPASARHRKGCKCKKMMCVMGFCECYQANVGCSDECRCKGCKNFYGQKGPD